MVCKMVAILFRRPSVTSINNIHKVTEFEIKLTGFDTSNLWFIYDGSLNDAGTWKTEYP